MKKFNKLISPLLSVLKIFSKFIFASFLSIFIFFILIISIYIFDNKINVMSGKYNYPIYSAYIIISESMIPKININDAVVNFRINKNKIEIGDVITFIFPKIGYFQNFLSKNIGMVFVVIFFCVFVILLDFFKYVSKKYVER